MLLTAEHQLIQQTARDFAQHELVPHSGQWSRDKHFPSEVLEKMAKLGFMGMLIPENYGGCGCDYFSYALAIEEIAAGDGAVSTIMSVHNSVACMPIYIFGTEQQKQEFLIPLASGRAIGAFCLTEPQAGSDAFNMKTTARLDGDEYVINGSKLFVTSGKHAKFAIVFAMTDVKAEKHGMSAFIVPTDLPGYKVVHLEDKLGQHASDTAQLSFEDLRIPKSCLLGAKGQGYKIALSNLEGGRIGIAAQAVGLAKAAFNAALLYSKDRETFSKPIIEHQAIGFRLADMATHIEAARQLTLHAALLKDAGQPCLKEAAMAKLFASEIAEKVCSDALQIHGGYGYLNDFPVAQLYCDARVTKIYEGTSDIQRMVIARSLKDQPLIP